MNPSIKRKKSGLLTSSVMVGGKTYELPEENGIKGTHFNMEFIVVAGGTPNEQLVIRLIEDEEDGAVISPFLFQHTYTLQQLIGIEKTLRIYDNVEEVKKCLIDFVNDKIKIRYDDNEQMNCIYFTINATAYNKQVQFDLKLEKKLKNKKPEDMIVELYKKMKEEINKMG